MIKHQDRTTIVECDGEGCDARDEYDDLAMNIFKEVIRDEGWHLRKHSKCLCMDCWDAGKR